MPLSRVRRVSLAHSVSSQIARAIVSGEFTAGVPISEPSLAAKLGVSRAPIREALIELELRGLVEFDPQGRTRVPTLTPEDLHVIHALRQAIDPLAAELAAQRADSIAWDEFEATIAATKDAKDLADISRLDAEFHDQIVRAAGNRSLLLCWTALRDQIELWLAQMQLRHQAATRRTRQETVEAHRGLLAAIRSGNARRAAETARRHVNGMRSFLPAAPSAPRK
jgi:DNA-binding GntR family transcriptional regulator